MRRVVVTGLGMVTPLAASVKGSWNRLIKSSSGISTIKGFEIADLPSKVAGQVPDDSKRDGFDPNRCLEFKEQKKVDKFIVYAIDAADQAIKDSDWVPKYEKDYTKFSSRFRNCFSFLWWAKSCNRC